MADDTLPESESGPAGPRVPIVIEGEATAMPGAEGEPSPTGTQAADADSAAGEPATPSGADAPRPARGAGVGFVSGIAGAVIGAAAALGAAWYFDPRAEPLRDLTARQSALEASASQEAAAEKALDARLGALESSAGGYAKTAALDALDKRLAALESAQSDLPKASALDAIDKRLGALESGQSDIAKASALDAIDKRLAKLETGSVNPDAIASLQTEAREARADAAKALAAAAASEKPAAPAPVPVPDSRIGQLVTDEAGLADRIAKLEAALAAPKAETRAAPTEVAPQVDAAGQAVAALALEQRLRAGEPFAAEFAALSRNGADPAALATLKPYADTGVPTAAALAASFAKIAPSLAEAAAPEESESGLDGWLGRMRKLVRVHAVGEVPGDDPAALISQIEAALARGQVASALSAYGRLPEAARKPAGDWAKTAEARVAADSAARALRDNAIGRLAAAKN